MTYSRCAVPSPHLQDAAQAGVIIVVPWILRPRRFWRRLALENIPPGMLQNFPDLRAAPAEKKGVKKFTLHCDMQTAHTPIRLMKKMPPSGWKAAPMSRVVSRFILYVPTCMTARWLPAFRLAPITH